MDDPRQFDVYWAEMSPCDHFVQIYEHDDVLLDALEGFVAGALRSKESAIIIATPGHRASLEYRLRRQGLDVDTAIKEDRYIALDADATLAIFMRDGFPDEDLFFEVIDGLLERSLRNGGRVRAFGEMVALLYGEGHSEAVMRLEKLWHSLCRAKSFALLCAYPRSGFTKDAGTSVQEICEAHSKVVGNIH
jgi:hypothetical protein